MKTERQKQLLLLPVFLWIVGIPLIEKTKIFVNPLQSDAWYSGEEYLSDIFLYYKSWIAVILACIMTVIFIANLLGGKNLFRKTRTDVRIFIPLILYLVLVLISSFFSDYRYFCIHGMPEQFESIWVVIAYIIATIYGWWVINQPESDCGSIVKCIFVGTVLVCMICVFQYCGIDIYQWIHSSENYNFTFEKGTVYGSFYNTNYVGFYVALMFPLFFLELIYSKNRWIKYLSMGIIAALFICIIGAHSLTAPISLASIFLFGTVFLMIKYIPQKKYLRIPLIVGVSLIFIACAVSYPKVHAYIKSCDTEKHDLASIYTFDDHVEFDYKDQQLSICMYTENGENIIDVKDQNNKSLNMQLTPSQEGYSYYSFSDDTLKDLTIAPVLMSKSPECYGFAIFLEDKNWCFTNQLTDDGTYYYYSDTGKLTKLTVQNKSKDFRPLINKSNLASGRGYIWNKTIALLSDYIVMGSGQDTFAMVYPNYDIVDRFNNGYGGLYTSRPHSLYLQIAIQSGVLSLICFVVFYVWYLISSIRIYYKIAFDNTTVVLGFSIMLGTLGYMVMGLANDSTVTVAPLYWLMIGIGVAINTKLKKTMCTTTPNV